MSRLISCNFIALFLLCGYFSLCQTLPENSPSRQDVFIMVDQMPSFPGGKEAMNKFITDNIKYPEAAVEERLEGKVLISAVINKEGKLRDIIAKGSADKILQEEAIRVVKLMPDWNPGFQKDIAVDVQISVPVNFKLGN